MAYEAFTARDFSNQKEEGGTTRCDPTTEISLQPLLLPVFPE
jgi:hypothetical protein